MRRRHWLMAIALLAAGCSSSSGTKKKKKKKNGGSAPTVRSSKKSGGIQRMNQGPQGFADVLLPSYIEDLKTGSADKKIKAARQLANMGSKAKSALPSLEKLAADQNPSVREAAKSAAAAIKAH